MSRIRPPRPAGPPDETALWDRYAAAALTGLLASGLYRDDLAEIARLACEQADEMMAAREAIEDREEGRP